VRVLVRPGRVGGAGSTTQGVSRFVSLFVASAAVALPACELFVGTDDFTTSADAASASGISMAGGNDASGGAADSSVDHETGDAAKGGVEGGGQTFSDAGTDASDAAAALCTVALGDSTCATCWKTQCCSDYVACLANTDCVDIAQCVLDCVSSPCDCTGSPTGMQLYVSLAQCGVAASPTDTSGNCGDCEAVGSGDPCYDDYNCFGAELCLADGFCTAASCAYWCSLADTSCAVDSDCAGNYATGTNENGQQMACVDTTGFGDTLCFPVCSTSQAGSCSAYPGTVCKSGVHDENGNTVSICE